MRQLSSNEISDLGYEELKTLKECFKNQDGCSLIYAIVVPIYWCVLYKCQMASGYGRQEVQNVQAGKAIPDKQTQKDKTVPHRPWKRKQYYCRHYGRDVLGENREV